MTQFLWRTPCPGWLTEAERWTEGLQWGWKHKRGKFYYSVEFRCLTCGQWLNQQNATMSREHLKCKVIQSHSCENTYSRVEIHVLFSLIQQSWNDSSLHEGFDVLFYLFFSHFIQRDVKILETLVTAQCNTVQQHHKLHTPTWQYSCWWDLLLDGASFSLLYLINWHVL